MAELKVRRVGYALGAEVRGVDLRKPFDDDTYAEIRRIWLENMVLCFPDQDIEKQQLMEFAARFGELRELTKSVFPDPANKAVALLTNRGTDGKPWNGVKSGISWHSDKSYTLTPSLATFLACKETPKVGGDTMFANLYMAYDTLSPAMRELVDALSAVHISPRRAKGQLDEIPTRQPLARVHPETGRKVLFIGDRAQLIAGMTEEESRPLLAYFTQHAIRYEFTYRHRWHVNDVVMWDNRCLLHRALLDYDVRNDPRHMLRCEVKGSASGEPYTGDVPAQLAMQHLVLN